MTSTGRPGAARWFTLAVLLLCSVTTNSLPAATVPDFEANYRIKRAGLILGSTRLIFRTNTSGEYTYKSTSGVGGFLSWFRKEHVSESSHGSMHAGGIRPDEYRFRRTGDRGSRVARVRFDWQNGKAVNTVDGVPWQMDILPGTLDKLVVQIAIMQQLQAGPSDLDFSIADGGKPKRYRIYIRDEETVNVPAGEFDTVRIEQEADNTRRKTILWAAPDLHYLPVKIMREESNGAVYYSVLESVKLPGYER
jgi:hypothetical protein